MAFLQLDPVEDFALLDVVGAGQDFGVEVLDALQLEVAEPELRPFVDGHRDEVLLLGLAKTEKNASARLHDLHLGLTEPGLHVPPLPVLVHHVDVEIVLHLLLDVLVQTLEEGDGPPLLGQLQASPQFLVRKDRVALELNLADPHLGAFVDVEDHLDRGGGDGLDGDLDAAQRAPVRVQQCTQGPPRLGQLGAVEGIVDGHSHLELPELLQHIRFLEGLHALVFDGSNERALLDLEKDDGSRLSLQLLHLGVEKEVGVEEAPVVAEDLPFVVDVPFPALDVETDGVLADAPIPEDADFLQAAGRLPDLGVEKFGASPGERQHQKHNPAEPDRVQPVNGTKRFAHHQDSIQIALRQDNSLNGLVPASGLYWVTGESAARGISIRGI